MKIEVIQIVESPNSTVSYMLIDGKHECFVVEDGYSKTKVKGETRIDGGVYYLGMRTHGRFYEQYKAKFGHEFAIEIKDVPKFSDILVHIGNDIEDTNGCNLANKGFSQDTKGNFFGIDSTRAYLDFYKKVAPALKRGEKVPYIVIRTQK